MGIFCSHGAHLVVVEHGFIVNWRHYVAMEQISETFPEAIKYAP